MRVNLNRNATVTLTKAGRARMEAYLQEMADRLPAGMVSDFYDKRCIPEDGRITRPIWELAHVFGEGLFMGCDTPFEGNEIQIEDPK